MNSEICTEQKLPSDAAGTDSNRPAGRRFSYTGPALTPEEQAIIDAGGCYCSLDREIECALH